MSLVTCSVPNKIDRDREIRSVTAKALFLTMRSRPDIRLAVAFLCTRVKNPTMHDWFKLQRMMIFLHRTQSECLTLALDGSRKVTWSIDAAFAVHPDVGGSPMDSYGAGVRPAN